MSTHGCRVECPSVVADDSWVWLGIAGLETQRCRVAWHCEEFVGLEFETPLSEAVFDRLLQDQKQLPENAIQELRGIAEPDATGWRGRASDADIAILAEISRQCAENAVVEGLRLSQPRRNHPPTSDAALAPITRLRSRGLRFPFKIRQSRPPHRSAPQASRAAAPA